MNPFRLLRSQSILTVMLPLVLFAALFFSSASAGAASQIPEGNLTLTGRFQFYNRAGTQLISERLLVQILRTDTNSLVTACYTGADGRFACGPFANPNVALRAFFYSYTSLPPYNDIVVTVDPGRGVSGSVDNAFRSSSSSNTYPDGTHDIGSWNVPHGSSSEGAFWILYDLIRTWRFIYDTTGAAQSPQETAGPATVEWSQNSVDGPYYATGGNIHLAGQDANFPTIAPRLYGANILYNTYGSLPAHTCAVPEKANIILDSDTICAWREGWGVFLALAVNNTSNYTWGSGDTLDLEPPTWGSSGWGSGDDGVGRAAGALWDIYDSPADGDDLFRDPAGVGNVWAVLFHHHPATLNEFWSGWRASGFDNSSAGPIMSLYQNTINYRSGPPNDDFSNAAMIASLPYTVSNLNTANATTQGNDPAHACGSSSVPRQSRSVWYRYTPSTSGLFTITTQGSSYDTVLGVWKGAFAALLHVGCNNNSGGGNQASLIARLTGGTTYSIEITHYASGAGGLLDLSITRTGNLFLEYLPLIR